MSGRAAPLSPIAALLCTSEQLGAIARVMSHPAMLVPVDLWPSAAFETQQACGIEWNWLDIVRFLGKVERVGTCLFWKGAKSRGKGNRQWYGTFWTKGKSVRAHKFAAVAILGLRPHRGSHEVDHVCHRTRCVSCLDVLTSVANQARIRRPKKRHLDLAKALDITPAEVMSMTHEKMLQYEMLVAYADQIVERDLSTGPKLRPVCDGRLH